MAITHRAATDEEKPNTQTVASVEEASPPYASDADDTGGGSAGGGGSSAPTDVLEFGNEGSGADIELHNGWTIGFDPARCYVQGGRVYLTGQIIAPGGSTDAGVSIPHDLTTTLVVDAVGFAVAAISDAGTIHLSQNGDGTVNLWPVKGPGGATLGAAAGIYLDGISWPLAA